jgi:hypothetical protein
MKWHWITDDFTNKKSWKSHAIPEVLYTAITESLHGRGVLSYNSKELSELSFDLPGMMMLSREYRKVEVDGLTIEIPCTDWEIIYDTLLSSKERTDAALPYYKIHGFYRCLCLTPAQRDEMLWKMLKLLPEANAQRELENRVFNEKMAASKKVAMVKPGENAEDALNRAEAEGKQPAALVAERPTKDDIGKA